MAGLGGGGVDCSDVKSREGQQEQWRERAKKWARGKERNKRWKDLLYLTTGNGETKYASD